MIFLTRGWKIGFSKWLWSLLLKKGIFHHWNKSLWQHPSWGGCRRVSPYFNGAPMSPKGPLPKTPPYSSKINAITVPIDTKHHCNSPKKKSHPEYMIVGSMCNQAIVTLVEFWEGGPSSDVTTRRSYDKLRAPPQLGYYRGIYWEKHSHCAFKYDIDNSKFDNLQ